MDWVFFSRYFPFVRDHDSLKLTLACNLISSRQMSFFLLLLFPSEDSVLNKFHRSRRMCLVNYRKLAIKVCPTVKILTDFAGVRLHCLSFYFSLVELSSSSSCCDSESFRIIAGIVFALFAF